MSLVFEHKNKVCIEEFENFLKKLEAPLSTFETPNFLVAIFCFRALKYSSLRAVAYIIKSNKLLDWLLDKINHQLDKTLQYCFSVS